MLSEHVAVLTEFPLTQNPQFDTEVGIKFVGKYTYTSKFAVNGDAALNKNEYSDDADYA